ncbi:Uncharacterised protein [Sebaldella termitidis]|uniref:DUF5405 domain-containing protein n=1 Tax=Sebaldella termitidis (strain ATCC 33386 / NCTC 11300) TaxID=526218 RepID=D1AQY5_SEBTE|nr:hypothetical protein [Sebaldella termitidis]ACZ07673.1 hypothetical protein Sterm_0801 [Sebaldella termitidis ATCC 33386]SUI22969.1 Uncharacterised protein [Sebaldella termitidis]
MYIKFKNYVIKSDSNSYQIGKEITNNEGVSIFIAQYHYATLHHCLAGLLNLEILKSEATDINALQEDIKIAFEEIKILFSESGRFDLLHEDLKK